MQQRTTPFSNSKFLSVQCLDAPQWVDIHYRCFGSQANSSIARGVMLVHGFGASAQQWDAIAQDITAKNQNILVVAVDLPGFGYSQRILRVQNLHSDSSRADLVSSVVEHLSKEIIDSRTDDKSTIPWTLIGHSLGARVIAQVNRQNIAATARGNCCFGIDSCVLLSPAPSTATLDQINGSGAITRLGRRIGSVMCKAMPYGAFSLLGALMFSRTSAKSSLKTTLNRDPTEQEIDEFLAPLKVIDPITGNTTAQCLGDMVTLLGNEEAEGGNALQELMSDFLQANRILRVLLLHGQEDSVIPVKFARYLEEKYREAIEKYGDASTSSVELRILGKEDESCVAGHYITQSHHKSTSLSINQFIADLNKGAAETTIHE